MITNFKEKNIFTVFLTLLCFLNFKLMESDHILVPGYSAWAGGGTTTEVISSATSDVLLTLVGGKVVKIGWKGSQSLYRGATSLGKKLFAPKKMMVIEVSANKVPYNPRAMEQLLRRDGAEVVSHTMPGKSGRNVKYAGMHKERTIVINPETGESIVQRVVFNERGLPILDPYTRLETKITGDLGNMSGKAHMRAATRQLKEDILSGKVDRKMFTDAEWLQIERGKAKIGEYTWHHHQDPGRMQLVDEDLHKWVGHVGGNDLWGMK